MIHPFRYLNPHAARARLLGAKATRRNAGFSLIETMAAMAIIAILALAIVPQFAKYMERAAVQNVVADVSSAQLLVESDHGLTANSRYGDADVKKSVADTKVNTETTLTASTNAATNTYKIIGTSTAVTSYDIEFDSGTSVLTVKRR